MLTGDCPGDVTKCDVTFVPPPPAAKSFQTAAAGSGLSCDSFFLSQKGELPYTESRLEKGQFTQIAHTQMC